MEVRPTTSGSESFFNDRLPSCSFLNRCLMEIMSREWVVGQFDEAAAPPLSQAALTFSERRGAISPLDIPKPLHGLSHGRPEDHARRVGVAPYPQIASGTVVHTPRQLCVPNQARRPEQSPGPLCKPGWLDQPAGQVFRRPRGSLSWQQVVRSLQTLFLRYPLMVGGRTALELQGFAHYLSRTPKPQVHLYGPKPPPTGWQIPDRRPLRLPQPQELFRKRSGHARPEKLIGATSAKNQIP